MERHLTDSELPIADEAQDLATRLRELMDHYAHTLTAHGMSLLFEAPETNASTPDNPLASGWVFRDDARRYLELAGFFVGYQFDDDDWLAVTTTINQNPHQTIDYLIVDSATLSVRLALADDGNHVTITVNGQPNRTLRCHG